MVNRTRAPQTALRFLLPAHSELISGGNLYNLGFLSALERCSEVERSSIDLLALRLEQRLPGIYLLDSLDLERASLLERRSAEQRFGLLVHHLPSLEPAAVGTELEREAYALSQFDFWVATSGFTRELLIGRGYPAERVLAVPPGAPAFAPTEMEASAGRKALSALPPNALIVANLIPRKAVAEWLSALSPELRPSDAFSLEIAGRTDLDPIYAGMARGLVAADAELSRRVRFLGEIPHPEMAATYAGASLLVSSSGMETFGIALQEARALGLPILALDRGNAREHVVHGVNGLLAPSLEALARAFLELVRAPERWQGLLDGAAGVPRAGDGWDAVVARFLAELARLSASWR